MRAWHRTYGLPVVITNCSNNYGPCQFPEKLIPLMILKSIEGKPLLVYGKAENIRDFLFVEIHTRALRLAMERGEIGHTYNIGGRCERTNLERVESICANLNELKPDPKGSDAVDFNKVVRSIMQLSKNAPAVDQFVLTD